MRLPRSRAQSHAVGRRPGAPPTATGPPGRARRGRGPAVTGRGASGSVTGVGNRSRGARILRPAGYGGGQPESGVGQGGDELGREGERGQREHRGGSSRTGPRRAGRRSRRRGRRRRAGADGQDGERRPDPGRARPAARQGGQPVVERAQPRAGGGSRQATPPGRGTPSAGRRRAPLTAPRGAAGRRGARPGDRPTRCTPGRRSPHRRVRERVPRRPRAGGWAQGGRRRRRPTTAAAAAGTSARTSTSCWASTSFVRRASRSTGVRRPGDDGTGADQRLPEPDPQVGQDAQGHVVRGEPLDVPEDPFGQAEPAHGDDRHGQREHRRVQRGGGDQPGRASRSAPPRTRARRGRPERGHGQPRPVWPGGRAPPSRRTAPPPPVPGSSACYRPVVCGVPGGSAAGSRGSSGSAGRGRPVRRGRGD